MRIRTVKPEFFTHPEIVQLSFEGRLLFLSLLTQADDEGRLRDQPRKIAGNAFGDDDEVDIHGLLQMLQSYRRILRYAVEGQRFIQVIHFSDHQRVNRPTPSLFPSPMPSLMTHGGFTEPSVPEVEVEVEVEVEQGSGTGKELSFASKPRTVVLSPPGFDVFWAEYPKPRRQGKGDARKAWVKAALRAPVDQILAGVRRFASDPNLPIDDEKFIPLPATWLNQDRWEDDPLPSRNGHKPSRAKQLLAEAIETQRREDEAERGEGADGGAIRSLPASASRA